MPEDYTTMAAVSSAHDHLDEACEAVMRAAASLDAIDLLDPAAHLRFLADDIHRARGRHLPDRPTCVAPSSMASSAEVEGPDA